MPARQCSLSCEIHAAAGCPYSKAAGRWSVVTVRRTMLVSWPGCMTMQAAAAAAARRTGAV